MASPSSSTTAVDRLSVRAWGALLVLCGAVFLDALDVSMIGVALPSIRTDLDMSTSSLQWVVSAYVLGYGGFLLLGGRAADLLGRRRMFLVALAVFLVGSGLGGLATGATVLIATRFVKGISAAFTAPAGLSLITTSFPEGPARNRAIASLVGVAAILAAFVVRERTAAAPLVRLGILRSGSLIRANLGAMTLFGGWVGFQFIATLYMQQLRGWSPLQTGLAIFPGGLLVALVAPRIAPLIARYGVTRLILVGMASAVGAYSLFLPIGLDSAYLTAMLPTFVLGGLGFAFAYGPLNIAATNGVAAEEQGLAGGLVNTSFQFGGALVLALVTAVE